MVLARTPRIDHPTSFDDALAELTVDDLPTVDALEARWREDEAAMRAWIARLGDAGLAGSCGAEDPPRHPMWVHVMHIYWHGHSSSSRTRRRC